ncbi:MAG TPA: DUF2520 domain-containing protein [Chitinophagaceae bacterium]|nr:DUF2520 domain-containing protein [Chitinophagaceae bacterium]
MQIVMIGTGNVATVLLKKLKGAGHTIVQVYGRNPSAAAALAAQYNALHCSQWKDIDASAALYIIALSDTALLNGEVQLQLQQQLVVHTAGAVSKNILQGVSASYGVLYPYQSIRKELDNIPPIPLLVDANTEDGKNHLLALATSISDQVSLAGDEERARYHLCAVMVNNFTNYLCTLAEAYCKKHGLQFTNLLPLIRETAERLATASPATVQTGPAIRHDEPTLQRHLQLLQQEPAMAELYQVFSKQIMAYPWP